MQFPCHRVIYGQHQREQFIMLEVEEIKKGPSRFNHHYEIREIWNGTVRPATAKPKGKLYKLFIKQSFLGRKESRVPSGFIQHMNGHRRKVYW